MSKQKIRLKLKQLHWHILADELRMAMQAAPVKGWELQTYIMADMYEKKMAFFQIYPYTSKGVKLSLTQVQAIAINQYLGAHSEAYNVMLRILIEPKLILG